MKLGIFQCARSCRASSAPRKLGWDSLQFTRHCDAFCTGPSPEALQRARAQGRDPLDVYVHEQSAAGATRGRSSAASTSCCEGRGHDGEPRRSRVPFRGWGGHDDGACDAVFAYGATGRAPCAPVRIRRYSGR